MTVRLFPDMAAAARFMNELGAAGIPFFFMTDFELQMPVVMELNSYTYSNTGIIWRMSSSADKPADKSRSDFSDRNHSGAAADRIRQGLEHIIPVSEKEFIKKIKYVQELQMKGHSYLLNLCFRSFVVPEEKDLYAIFSRASAPYCLYVNTDNLKKYIFSETENMRFSDYCASVSEFTVFSPEPFVRIRRTEKGAVISAFPMKGTIDADIPYAAEILLNDEKELAEHRTVTDLLRNDLGRVASRIRVEKFRYVESVHTSHGRILQTSSLITGQLSDDWKSRTGSIIASLLPAGSVSGAPREETCRIIRETEPEPRGYYTGVAGVFDGKSLESFVMIRFLEKNRNQSQEEQLFSYRSGCGITIYSDPESEYRELLNKIYVPFV